MKIVCDKKEYAQLVRMCEALQHKWCTVGCAGCVLEEMCGELRLEDVLDIEIREVGDK